MSVPTETITASESSTKDGLGQEEFRQNLDTVIQHVLHRFDALSELPTLPPREAVAQTITSLPASLPDKGLGVTDTTSYLLDTLLPGILQAQSGPRYFGFVTGGVTPAAQLADILVGSYDENVQVTLPGQTAATAIEARTLEMVLDLLYIDKGVWKGRTITTGATASNVLGLACARDYLYAHSPHLPSGYSYAQSGPPTSYPPELPSPPIILLTLHPHYSILKAASLVGIGSGPNVVHSIQADPADELAFHLPTLRERLAKEKEVGRGVIVCYGLGEVNTGGIGGDLREVAMACEEFGAWLHVDAAFGGFAGLVPELKHLTSGMELAHSVTLDGHKWLNVPYDCGLFFTRDQSSLTSLFAPPIANTPAYLSAGKSANGSDTGAPSPAEGQVVHELVPSPLYVNIENSRRFRALPLFASLLSLGKQGYIDIIRRNISFAQQIATFLSDHPSYTLLNALPSTSRSDSSIVPMNIVLFRGSPSSPFPEDDPSSGTRLTAAINASRRIYVTATAWRGVGAVRLAVSNWRTGSGSGSEVDEDLEIVKDVLDKAVRQ